MLVLGRDIGDCTKLSHFTINHFHATISKNKKAHSLFRFLDFLNVGESFCHEAITYNCSIEVKLEDKVT